MRQHSRKGFEGWILTTGFDDSGLIDGDNGAVGVGHEATERSGEAVGVLLKVVGTIGAEAGGVGHGGGGQGSAIDAGGSGVGHGGQAEDGELYVQGTVWLNEAINEGDRVILTTHFMLILA